MYQIMILSWKLQQAVVTVTASLYKFDEYKSKTEKAKDTKLELQKITWMVPHKRDVEKAETWLTGWARQ